MKEKMGSNCEAITKESLLQRNYFWDSDAIKNHYIFQQSA